MIQMILLIALFVIEVLAFGWLIIEAKVSRKQRETILEVEKQILNLEKTIISMERTIIKKLIKNEKNSKRKNPKRIKTGENLRVQTTITNQRKSDKTNTQTNTQTNKHSTARLK
tara:strand:- start:1412 stop:1753 length:342 start_codon:yes stop_codon:yes gene_type:complete